METETNQEASQPQKSNSNEKRIAGSIILAALIISAAIFYSNKELADALSGKQLNMAAVNAPTVQAAAAQAAPAAPTGPVTVTDRANEPVLGNANAKVTMVEFGDFQCPFCQEFYQQALPELKSKYIDTGKMKLIFRHWPLQPHVNAQISAIAAECANQQGKFWDYYNTLYNNAQADGTNLAVADLKKYAVQLGIGNATFNACVDSKSTLPIVNADLAEGTKDQVQGTPTFYINGQQVVGAQAVTAYEQVIDAALKQ